MCDERQIASEFESTAICTFDTDDTEGSADAVLANFFIGHERGYRSISSNRHSFSFFPTSVSFLTRLRSDATAPILGKLSPHAVRISPHVCACPPAWPSGRSAAVSPPSLLPSFLPAALRSRHRGQRQHHASQPGQLPPSQGGFALRGRRH